MEYIDLVVSASWHADEAAAYQFFGALHESADLLRAEGSVDRDALGAALTERGVPIESVEALIERLEQGGVSLDEALDAVVAESPEALLERYNEFLREAYAAAGTDPDQDGAGAEAADALAEDPDAWNAYLATNGPAWDGAEDTWTQFTDWFLYHAAEAGVGQSAQAFLDYVAAEPDKVATFAAYGVDLTGPGQLAETDAEASAPVGGEPADLTEQQISELAADVLADLDGTPAEAGAPGEAGFADLTEQEISALAAEALADLDDGSSGGSDGFEEGDLAALFGEAGIEDTETISVEQAVEVVGDKLIAEFRSANPEFEDTSDEELRELLAEILTEEAALAS